ncbi:MAG TPA: CoA-binding protein [Terriglobales bacterium]|nr:CoA-binding protein [Terriglobales bacterium]
MEDTVVNLKEILRTAGTVLVIDWPSKDVPEALTLAGFHVIVHGGLGPENYAVHELDEGKIVIRHLGHRPESADLIYSYRPFSELQQILDTAKALHAKTIWAQSGLSAAGVNDTKGCGLLKRS